MPTDREILAKEYDAVHNRLFVVQILLVVALLALYQFSGVSEALVNGLSRRFGADLWYVANAVYIMVTVFGFAACMSPLSYYTGFVLESHYELSDDSFGDWLGDYTKSLMIDLALATVLFSVIYAFLRWIPDWWWLFAAGFYVLFTVVFSTLIPLFIIPFFHEFESLEEGELTMAIRQMLSNAGVEVEGVYKWGISDRSMEASVGISGVGRSRRVVLGDSLLSGYSQDEILAILANEIGHYKSRDAVRMTVVGSLLALVGFYVSHLCLTGLSALLGFVHIYDIATAPLFIFSLFVFSLIAMPFSNMHSRHREFAADAYAIDMMGGHGALISALEKIADDNLSNKEPAAWIEFLTHSHPSMARRISRAQKR